MGMRRTGMTLVELLMVLFVLLTLAGMLVPLLSGLTDDGRLQVTRASLHRLHETVMGTPDRPGYLIDLRKPPQTIRDLFVQPGTESVFDINTRRGWRGPYLLNTTGRYLVDLTRGFTTSYGQADDPAVLDGWGNPIVLQWPVGDSTGKYARLISAGPDGVLNTPPTKLTPADLTAADRGDDLILFLQVADVPSP